MALDKPIYRVLQRNREFIKEVQGLSSFEEMMDLNKDKWHLSKYKPISDRFDPKWFAPAKLDAEKNKGSYTTAPFGSAAYREYWTEQLRRCRDGYTVHGYFCPGDLYNFLNFYVLPVVVTVNGRKDRVLAHPHFWEAHYCFAHYIEWCKALEKDAVCVKPRGVGWSEYVANMGCNMYNSVANSVTMFCASKEQYLIKDGILNKAWRNLDWVNENTQKGFKRLRQNINSKFHKRASLLDRERVESGWRSEIIGQVIDSPDKLRGTRTNYLVFEELGSFRMSKKTVMTAKALTEIGGEKFGTLIGFGTGGDESSGGEALEGLMDMYYKPSVFNMLPIRHKFTQDGSIVETGFFFPVYLCMQKYMDSHGVTDIELAYNHYKVHRDNFESEGAVEELRNLKAEYPFWAEEAFLKSGTNIFDSIKIANQMIRLKQDKTMPKPKRGELQWVYAKGTRKITGVEFIENINGRVVVLEEPERDPNGKLFKNLYIGGIDGIDMGANNSLVGADGSKFCAVVKKKYLSAEKTGNLYVAYYLDRPGDERDAFEISLKLAIWYNCKFNVERTKKEVISYFRDKGMLQYMAKQPSIWSGGVDASKIPNIYGSPAHEKVVIHYNNKIKEYVCDFSELIFFEEILKQLGEYSIEMKRKFDMIAAMGMCEMLDEEYDASGLVAKSTQKATNNMRLFGYYYDTDGYKQFGALPERESFETQYTKLGYEAPKDLDSFAEVPPLNFVDPCETNTIGTTAPKLLFELSF